MSNPKGHHFLPRFYLRSFSTKRGDNPPIWVHERGKRPKKLRVSEVAKQKHFYSTRKEIGGERDTAGEKALSKIECDVAPVYRKIIESQGEIELSDDERVKFAAFVVLMSLRTPRNFEIADHTYKELIVSNYHEGVKKTDDKTIAHIISDTKRKNPELLGDMPFEEAKQAILDGPTREHVALSHSAGIYDMWMSFSNSIVVTMLLDRNWQFFVADGDAEFITTDDPVVCSIPSSNGIGTTFLKGGWGHPSLSVMFPLSPKLCFEASSHIESGKFYLTADSVPINNRNVVMMSQKYVYASRKQNNVENYMKERDAAQAMQPEPVKITELI